MRAELAFAAECKFWDNPGAWMFDTPRHVFMARAVDRLGAAMFPDWTNSGTIKQSDPSYPEVWRRRQVIRDRIREECAAGALVAAYQTPQGEIAELPAHRWNNFDHREWFQTCTISSPEVDSLHHPLAKVLHYPLFLTRKSLERLLAKNETPEAPPAKKKNYALAQVMDWAQPIFDEAEKEGKPNYTRDDFVKAAQLRFPGIGVDLVRNTIWEKRPSVYPRRPRGL
jgi:hypothetical protein